MRFIFRIIFRTILFIISFLFLYAAAAYFLPKVRSENCKTVKTDSLSLFVLSNGVHTDLVVPYKSKYKDWSAGFPLNDFSVKDSLHNYIAFGWGDKGFYLDAPEWSDLKFSTAFNAVFGLGGTAMHVRYIREPELDKEKCVLTYISEKQYADLIDYVEQSFALKSGSTIKIDHPGYGNHDLFYEAVGRYSALKTCNIWTNRGLKKLGIKVGFWTPFSGGLITSMQ